MRYVFVAFCFVLASCASVETSVTPIAQKEDRIWASNPDWTSIPVYVSESLLDPQSKWTAIAQIKAQGNAHADENDLRSEVKKQAASIGAHALVEARGHTEHFRSYSKHSGTFVAYRRDP